MPRPVEEVWMEVLDRVSEHINAPSLRVWFEGTRPVGLYEHRLEISVPNSFAKEYIESRFKLLLEEALDSTLDQEGTSLVISIEGTGGTEKGNGRGMRSLRTNSAPFERPPFVVSSMVM